MVTHDPRIDTYIAESAPFARPILEYIRRLVHTTCAEVEETIKWGAPHFQYRSAPLCRMAAFKQHCSFGFWLHKAVLKQPAQEGMGQFGKLTCIADLPGKKQLASYIRKAMALTDAGTKLKRPKLPPKPSPQLPDDLAALLATEKHTAAWATYTAFSTSARREYINWIAEARTEATRLRRIDSTLTWLAEGKPRHWKYLKK